MSAHSIMEADLLRELEASITIHGMRCPVSLPATIVHCRMNCTKWMQRVVSTDTGCPAPAGVRLRPCDC